MIHAYETRHQENLEFAAGDRLPFEQLQEQRALLCSPSFMAVIEALPQPLLFFNEQRQLVHVNAAALKLAQEANLEGVIGLRMGEFLGCDHVMEGETCKNKEECQNCNRMDAIMGALSGQTVHQPLKLVIHPRSERRRQAFDVTGVPVPCTGHKFAMVMLETAE